MKLIPKIIITSLCLASSIAFAEVAVIVNPANSDTLSKDEIARLYMAKARTFSNGVAAAPIDLPEGSALRLEFDDKVLGKEENQLKSYWSRLIFTGKAVPPRVANSDAEVIDIVKSNKDAIGYINAGSVDSSVRVVGTFK